MTLETGSFESIVVEIHDRFTSGNEMQDNWMIAQEVVRDLGGNAVNIGRTSSSGGQISFGRSSMTEAWLEQYERKNYHLVDPFIKALTAGSSEVVADCGTLGRQDPAYDLNHDLKLYGYGSLFATMSGSVPGYRSMVVFCSKETLSEVNARIGFNLLRVVHAVFAANIMEMTDPEAPGSVKVGKMYLSQKECDVLSWLACGLRNDQIAYKLNIAEITVRKHLLSVRKKLAANTREEAIAIALRDGWINI